MISTENVKKKKKKYYNKKFKMAATSVLPFKSIARTSSGLLANSAPIVDFPFFAFDTTHPRHYLP